MPMEFSQSEALESLKAVQAAISRSGAPTGLALESVDTYLVLHIGALVFGVAMGLAMLVSPCLGLDVTREFLSSSDPANAALRRLFVAATAALLAIVVVTAYGFIGLNARSENAGFGDFSRRYFDYFRSFAGLSDLITRFAMVVLLILAARAGWIAPLCVLFVGDILLQGRLLTLRPRTAVPAGLACLAMAATMFALGWQSPLWPLAVGSLACAASLARILYFRSRLVAEA